MIDRDADKVTLKVNGMEYWGWKSISVKNALETFTNTFDLSVIDRWPGMDDAWAIAAGDFCEVMIGNDIVLTGYIEKVSASLSATSHEIGISGRGKTCDLIDCSATPKEWLEMDGNGIIMEIAAPFGIGVVPEVATDILNKFAINSGDTCQKVIEKIAQMQGALTITNAMGELVITRAGLAGEAVDVLTLGGNLKELQLDEDHTEVFSEIKVKGQANTSSVAKDTDPFNTSVLSFMPLANPGSGHAPIDRYRPLIIMAEEQALEADCAYRAGWEASTRAARAKKITCTVAGWRQTNGTLWGLNTLVRLDCPWARTDEQWLISGIEYTIGSDGTVCKMILYSPKAFQVLAECAPAKAPKNPERKKHKTEQKPPQKLSGAVKREEIKRYGNR